MGLFDYFRSSYPLGEAFTEVECQTKDMETSHWLGGTMTHYWLDPGGYLYRINDAGTADFEIIEESDPRYDPDRKFLNYEWVPNGNHGKVEPHYITHYVEVYPATWEGKWEDWPRCRLHFRAGKLIDFEEVTGQ